MKRPKYRNYRFYCCETCGKRYRLKKLVPQDGCCKDSLLWDSEKEYRRWGELKLLEKKGEISELQRQLPFRIGILYYKPKCFIYVNHDCFKSEIVYKADFTYIENKKLVVEDTKGYHTREYKKKKMLMKKIYGIDVRET